MDIDKVVEADKPDDVITLLTDGGMPDGEITLHVHKSYADYRKTMERYLTIITDQVPKTYHTAIGEFIVLNKEDIPRLADLYISWVETATTAEACKCEWAVHPDDVGKDPRFCRTCGMTEDEHPVPGFVDGTASDPGCETFVADKRRLRLKNDHPLCPVHVKIGRVVGFFEWLFMVHLASNDSASS